MGYRGKVEEQERARQLRAEGRTLEEIAAELRVSKSSASVWTRGVVAPVDRPRRSGPRNRPPNALQRRKQAEIEELDRAGLARIGTLDERGFLVAGIMLYIGEGAKTDGAVCLPNSDPKVLAFFCAWLRHFFEIDESRLRGAVTCTKDWTMKVPSTIGRS